MRKLLNSPWFVAVLALVALVVVGQAVLFAPKDAVPSAPEAGPQPEAQRPPEAAPSSLEAAPAPAAEGAGHSRLSMAQALKALSHPATVRDPFALPVKPEAAEGNPLGVAVVEVVDRLRLSATWVQGQAVFLLLNGRICQPGDEIERFTVETADVDGAWIRHHGARSFLSVGQELVVKTSVPAPPSTLSK
jgi:hypothetical protein